jgi:hypothetical protein
MSEYERRLIPAPAAAGLKARYRAHAATERDLTSFLAGLTAALEIPAGSVRGFDDETGELLLEPAEEAAD